MRIRSLLLTSVAALAAVRFTPFINAVDPSEVLETIEIKTPTGTARINRSDFNPYVHTAVNKADAAFAAPTVPPASPAAAIPPAPGMAAPTEPPASPAAIPPAPGMAAPASLPQSPAPAPVPVEYFVTKSGTGKAATFAVTDRDGKPLDGFEASGYPTETAAQDAIAAKKSA